MKASQDDTSLPVSLFFLKSIVAALGIVLVAGFVFVIGILLLGGKYFVEQTEFSPYKLAQNVTLTPAPDGKIISAKTSPIGVEILSQKKDGKLYLNIYQGETGKKFSEITVK